MFQQFQASATLTSGAFLAPALGEWVAKQYSVKSTSVTSVTMPKQNFIAGNKVWSIKSPPLPPLMIGLPAGRPQKYCYRILKNKQFFCLGSQGSYWYREA